jgi:hypothetical protein
VVEALQQHFEEVSDNMARRWPEDEPPAVVEFAGSRGSA